MHVITGRSFIVSYCDRSTKQLFCICLVVYCFKVLVVIAVIANQRGASSSYWSTPKSICYIDVINSKISDFYLTFGFYTFVSWINNKEMSEIYKQILLDLI